MNKVFVVTIGRNVGDNPMSRESWAKFKSRVQCVIEANGGCILQRPVAGREHDQIGTWDGGSEDAAAFVAYAQDPALRWIRLGLSELREQFNQDAIGFIVAADDDTLITA